MKYKTIIEVESEANDELEAVDIAGEFLRGHLEDGVKMKLRTTPIRHYKVLLQRGFVVMVFASLIGISLFTYLRTDKTDLGTRIPFFKNVSAVQPPLKTSSAKEFKKSWKEKEDSEAFEYIKK